MMMVGVKRMSENNVIVPTVLKVGISYWVFAVNFDCFSEILLG